MKSTHHTKEKTNLLTRHFYNIGQLRAELWTELKLKTYVLARKQSKDDQEESKAQMHKLLKTLLEVEQYFAFPGTATLNVINDFLKHDEFQILKNSIKKILRLLVSEDYRQDAESFSFATLLKGEDNKQLLDPKTKRRYFEVLFVDNLATREENVITKKLTDVRNPKDTFVYQLVYTKSFQDTLIALMANPNIQACVIRYEIPFKSKNARGILKPFVKHFLKDNFEDVPEYE